MKKIIVIAGSILLLSLAGGLNAQQKDTRGCNDHPAFNRMPDYWIHSCVNKQFESYGFVTGKNKATTTVEGQYWKISYYPQAQATSKPSETQILRNFENAVEKQGGKSIYKEKARETFRMTKDGKELWVEVTAEFTGKYGLIIVQKEGMAQDIVASAEMLSNDINATGHAAVYGIYFDTGKSTIKPESAQAIEEIAKLLNSKPALKIYVVGHTDNVGGTESNLKLSQERAEAVLQSLVQTHKIASSRLKAYGCGLYSPVTSNDTEEGRAKNRRVELVKQ